MSFVLKPNLATEKIESWLETNHIWAYIILICVYILMKLPDILVAHDLESLVFPLNALYFSKLLFSDDGLNRQIANTIITPANAIFIYPPGTYILTSILGSVKNICQFLFFIQMIIPLLLFKLFRGLTTNVGAMLLTMFLIMFSITTNRLSPDYLIYPFMTIAFLILFINEGEGSLRNLIIAGLLSGVIIVLKHNVGVFFGVLYGTSIFFRSFKFSEKSTKHNAFMYLLFAGFLSVGIFFLTRLPNVDEIIYYLLPYFFFWILVWTHIIRDDGLIFDRRVFIKKSAIYGFFTLILPVIVFLWFGSVVGYKKYFFSLFGMGFQYLHFWDSGIINLIRGYLKFGSIGAAFGSSMIGIFILFPFVVNLVVLCFLYRISKTDQFSEEEKIKYFQVASLGILAVFMFFPLEGHHQAPGKIFIYFAVLLYFLKNLLPQSKKIVFLILLCMLIPVAKHAVTYPLNTVRLNVSYGSQELQKIVGMPMLKGLAYEFSRRSDVIKRSVKGDPYYVIDASTGGVLTAQMAIIDNKFLQYYIRMDKGILNQEVTDAIIASLKQIPFVIINRYDYNQYLNNTIDSQYLKSIIDFVHNNYTLIDKYETLKDHLSIMGPPSDFVVMSREN